MNDFLLKIEKLKQSKLSDFENALKAEHELHLKELFDDKTRLEKSFFIKSKQRETAIKSKQSIEIETQEISYGLEQQNLFLTEFVNEFISDLEKSVDDYKTFILHNFMELVDPDGTLAIDETTYNLIKKEIKDKVHIKIDNNIKGFRFISNDIELEVTLDTLKNEIIEKYRSDLLLRLFPNE